MDEELTPQERKDDKANKRRKVLLCVYCNEAPRQNGQACYRCHNDDQRRERFNPLRAMYKKFLGV